MELEAQVHPLRTSNLININVLNKIGTFNCLN